MTPIFVNQNRIIQGGPETLMNLSTQIENWNMPMPLTFVNSPIRHATNSGGRPHAADPRNAADPPATSPQNLISRGRLEPLHFVPFHANGTAPVSRRVLAGAGVHESLGKHIVSHEIRNVPAERRSYCEPHVHECDEINFLLSDSHLSYEIRLGDEVFVVNAPATIHIPAGVVHSANVIEGSGFYIAIVDTPNYNASVGSGTGKCDRYSQSNEALPL
ncbi:MAG TPA: hypothetical protein VHZ55_22615 [Bryobacteraceae bacterium]|nr:hypothetical protein [Bryobacteraceae bacterium]